MNVRHPRRSARVIGALALTLGLTACGAAAAKSPGRARPGSEPASPQTGGPVTNTPGTDPATLPPPNTMAPTVVAPTVVAPTVVAPTVVAPTVVAPTVVAPQPPPVRSGANVNERPAVGEPLRIVVPSVNIDGPIVGSGLLADGTIDVPSDPHMAGWFSGGPRPGELGPAVIVGHVDSRKFGLGVFWGLDKVAAGAAVNVQTTTGDEHFVVVATQRIPKVDFPTADVYGLVPNASLRLITCGGSFDRSIGHYLDNIVVYLERTNG